MGKNILWKMYGREDIKKEHLLKIGQKYDLIIHRIEEEYNNLYGNLILYDRVIDFTFPTKNNITMNSATLVGLLTLQTLNKSEGHIYKGLRKKSSDKIHRLWENEFGERISNISQEEYEGIVNVINQELLN